MRGVRWNGGHENRRRLWSGARAAVAGVLVLACLASPVLAEPAGRPVLRVGTSGDYAPFSIRGEGFDVEVARRLAAAWGRELEWVPFAWPELGRAVEEGRFDLAMSGVTWRPERAVAGYLSRAVAAGGPCVLGDPTRGAVAVNRGGALERWARGALATSTLRPVERNLDLPGLLARGEVAAIVTDSFELPAFRAELGPAAGARVACEPPRQRKVYWVAPDSAELGPRLDAWLAAEEGWLADQRVRWLGDPAPRGELDHLIDLLARRLAMMPAVAAWKRPRGLPIEDLERERRVLDRVAGPAEELGLPRAETRALFELQIELAKAVQSRYAGPDAGLDLDGELRPLLLRLGDRILASLGALPPGTLTAGDVQSDALVGPGTRWGPLHAELEPGEVMRLAQALAAVQAARRRGPAEAPED